MAVTLKKEVILSYFYLFNGKLYKIDKCIVVG